MPLWALNAERALHYCYYVTITNGDPEPV